MADTVRAERSRRRLSQQQLAEAAGVEVGVIQRLESSNSTRGVGLKTAQRVFDALGLRLWLGYPENPSPYPAALDPGNQTPPQLAKAGPPSPRRRIATGSPRRRSTPAGEA